MARRRNNRLEGVSMAEAYEGLRSDYNAARSSRYRRRRKGLPAMGGMADFHYRNESDYLRMMETSRDMYRNDVIANTVVERFVDNVVSDGMMLDPKTGDEETDARLRQKWITWATDANKCDTAGELTFYHMEQMILRQTIVDGDIFVMPIKDGSIQLIEAHRVRSPRNTKRNVVHGILLDKQRRHKEYWITKDEISPILSLNKVGDILRIPARDSQGNKQVFHIANPRRVSQTRGITAFAPVFDLMGMFEDLNFAKLVQAQIVSCFAIFRQRGELWEAPGGDVEFGERTVETLAGGTKRTVEGIAPGMELIGERGEDLKGFSPNVPNAEFFQHATLIITLISANLGVPPIALLLDATKTNFSGWRGAINQARIAYSRYRAWMIARFHRPVYQFKVRGWMLEDDFIAKKAIELGESLFRHSWTPPRFQYIEPLKDATADLTQLKNALTSPRRLQAERGRDWDDVYVEIVEDNAKAIRLARKAAVEINSEFDDGTPVHWRELVSLPTPGIDMAGQMMLADQASGGKNSAPAG